MRRLLRDRTVWGRPKTIAPAGMTRPVNPACIPGAVDPGGVEVGGARYYGLAATIAPGCGAGHAPSPCFAGSFAGVLTHLLPALSLGANKRQCRTDCGDRGNARRRGRRGGRRFRGLGCAAMVMAAARYARMGALGVQFLCKGCRRRNGGYAAILTAWSGSIDGIDRHGALPLAGAMGGT